MRTVLLMIYLLVANQLTAESIQTVIFAAGESKRFGSDTSKILTPMCDGKPMVWHPIHAAADLNQPITLVLGHQKEAVRAMALEHFPHARIDFAIQDKQLGTGHALQCTRSHWQADNILVLNGDHPLTCSYMLSKLILSHEQTNADVSILIAQTDAVSGWGRIVQEHGTTSIVEAADFDKNPADYPYINTGYYVFKRTFLEEHIDKLQLHKNKGEYYITDLIEIANQHNLKIQCVEVELDDVFGINTQEEFKYAEQLLKERLQPLPRAIFKEYDIRGIVGSELHINQMYQLGKSLAYFFKYKQPQVKTVAIGMDGRTHSPAIKDQLAIGLQDGGLDVLFVGLCPSPGLYFATHTLPVDAGIMITASHNPKEYNDLKIYLGAAPIGGQDIQELYECYIQSKQPPFTKRGQYTEHPIVPEYVAWLAQEFKHLRSMKLSKHATPEFHIPCTQEQRTHIIEEVIQFFSKKQNAQLLTIDGVRVTLPYGLGLLRVSNTEPVLSMRFESETIEGLERIKNDFSIAMRKHMNRTQLRKHPIE